jgi:hypothetical protein
MNFWKNRVFNMSANLLMVIGTIRRHGYAMCDIIVYTEFLLMS